MEHKRLMRILVTGNKGYIGTVLTPMLVEAGHEVAGFDCDYYRDCDFHAGGPTPRISTLSKDIREAQAADFTGFDAVIHLAALSNDPLCDLLPEMAHSINYEGALRVAKAAKAAGVERFVFASSCSNYGKSGSDFIDEDSSFNPVTPYATSKVDAEQALRSLADEQFCPVFLRAATVYGLGPRIRFDLVVNNLVAWATLHGEIRMKSDGTPWRPVVHVEDVCRAFCAALETPADSVRAEAFNVGITKDNYQVGELAEIIAQTIPNCRISFEEGAGPDKRSYRVNCDKIARAMPSFRPQWNIERGIRSLHEAYLRDLEAVKDFESPRFQRIGHLRKLIDEKVLTEELRNGEKARVANA